MMMKVLVLEMYMLAAMLVGFGSEACSLSKVDVAELSIGENGLDLIKSFEGFYSQCYLDPVGIWTIGYGHACHVNANDGSGCLANGECDSSVTLSREQATSILRTDMDVYEACVRSNVFVPLNQNQFDALVSFTFNLGCGNLKSSTLLRKLNNNELTNVEAQYQFSRWTYGGGTCLEGLKRRRFTEAKLFNSCAAESSFACDESACSVSLDYKKCSTNCAYCTSCGGCSGTSADEVLEETTASPTPPPTPSCDEQGQTVYYIGVPDLQFDRVVKIKQGLANVKISVNLHQAFGDEMAIQVTRMNGEAPSLSPTSIYQVTTSEGEPEAGKSLFEIVIFDDSNTEDNGDEDTNASGRLVVGGTVLYPLLLLIGSLLLRDRPFILALAAVVVSMMSFGNGQCAVDYVVDIYVPTRWFEDPNFQAIPDKSTLESVVWNESIPTGPAEAECRTHEVIASQFPLTCNNLAGNNTFRLTNVVKFLDVDQFPHQKCALDQLAIDQQLLARFGCLYAGQSPSAQGCGVFITPLNMTFDPENENHVAALNDLQQALETTHGAKWLDFINHFRKTEVCVSWEIREDLRCGENFSNAGCPVENDYCCSADGFCGSSLEHCSSENSWDYRNGDRPKDVSNEPGEPVVGVKCGISDVCTTQSTCEGNGGAVSTTSTCSQDGHICCEELTLKQFIVTGPACKDTIPGVCIDTGECAAMGGTSTALLCPGASNIRCCEGSDIIPKVLIEGDRCKSPHSSGEEGVCMEETQCSLYDGVTDSLKCAGPSNIKCCAGSHIVPSFNDIVDDSTCLGYHGAEVFSIEGNNGVVYDVVKILPEHLSVPSYYDYPPDEKDNTMTVGTACAFAKMAKEASSIGISIKISSGFRTVARQQYFYDCYLCQCCNGGNLAAVPGTSKHGVGIALDLNTGCSGKQTTNTPPCSGSSVYSWLASNGAGHGFQRTVYSEPWHWEFYGASAQKTYYT